jgi:hypothetical protein
MPSVLIAAKPVREDEGLGASATHDDVVAAKNGVFE